MRSTSPSPVAPTCRRKVTVEAKSPEKGLQPITSEGTLFHRFRVPRNLLARPADGDRRRADDPPEHRSPAWNPEALQFVVLGDSRTNPADWRQVAKAANARNPQLVVISGDLVATGRDDVPGIASSSVPAGIC